MHNTNYWWFRIAWAFLRPISIDGEHQHTGSIRLQLYKPISYNVNDHFNGTTQVILHYKEHT